MYYTYVLQSTKSRNFYHGYTPNNVFQRCEKHNSGFVKSTKRQRPWKVIYYEAHLNRADALRRESYFKTTSGRRALKFMLRCYLDEICK